MQKNAEDVKRTLNEIYEHMKNLYDFAANGDSQAVQDYLNNYADTLDSQKELIICKNYALNSLINYYISRGQKLGVVFSDKADVPENLNAFEVDFCIVIGNLLENAIEACERDESSAKFVKINNLFIQ